MNLTFFLLLVYIYIVLSFNNLTITIYFFTTWNNYIILSFHLLFRWFAIGVMTSIWLWFSVFSSDNGRGVEIILYPYNCLYSALSTPKLYLQSNLCLACIKKLDIKGKFCNQVDKSILLNKFFVHLWQFFIRRYIEIKKKSYSNFSHNWIL